MFASCVERGPWRYNSAEFAPAERALFSKALALGEDVRIEGGAE